VSRGKLVAKWRRSHVCPTRGISGETLRDEKRSEKGGKYRTFRRNRKTENDALIIFEREPSERLYSFCARGLNDDSPRLAETVKLFRERGVKPR
jgi:hypothetical protein